MSRALLVLVLLALALPAEAHRLRLFATVEDGTIRGHAFFVGGGRPEGARITFTAGGAVVHELRTAADGAFTWRPTAEPPITVTVDTGDGHGTAVTLGADRFGGAAAPSFASPANAVAPPAARLDPAVTAAIEAAVARQVAPLLEAAQAAEARLRLNDVVGGIGMIVGLAGIALWARARGR